MPAVATFASIISAAGCDRTHLCCQSPNHLYRAGKPSVVQLLNYKKNGDPFINYLSITPIHDSRGHVTHFVGIQSDISDLVNHKKAELAAKHEAAQASCSCPLPSAFSLRNSYCYPHGSGNIVRFALPRANCTCSSNSMSKPANHWQSVFHLQVCCEAQGACGCVNTAFVLALVCCFKNTRPQVDVSAATV